MANARTESSRFVLVNRSGGMFGRYLTTAQKINNLRRKAEVEIVQAGLSLDEWEPVLVIDPSFKRPGRLYEVRIRPSFIARGQADE